MENKKSGKGLVITLVIFILAFATCAALLFTGVIKSPMVKEKDCNCPKCTDTTKDDTKKSDTKTNTTTEKTADERYKEYVTGLADSIKNDYYTKTANTGFGNTSFYRNEYTTVNGNYTMSIDKDLKLVYAKQGSDSTTVAENVVAYFRVHTGNGTLSTIYYITTDAKLYSVDIEKSLDMNSNYEIKEISKKNIINVVSGTMNGAGGENPVFIDIDGNVITE